MRRQAIAALLLLGLLLSLSALAWHASPSQASALSQEKAFQTTLEASGIPSALATPAADAAEPAQLPPGATGPGIYILYDEPEHNLDQAHGYPVTGGHHRYGWNSLEPNYDGDYRFDQLILPWIQQEAARGKKVAIGFTTYNGRGGGLAVPSWLWQRDPNVRLLNTVSNDGWYLLNYLNRTYVNEYREFIEAFATWVANTPVVRNTLAWIEIGTGQWGENQPARKFGTDNADWQFYANVLNWQSADWINHCNEVAQFYRNAFNARGLTSLPIYTNMAPTFRNGWERDTICDYAASIGVGLKNSGILPDHDNAANSYKPLEKWGNHPTQKVPIAFEAYGLPYLTQAAEWYWTVLCGLDKRADVFVIARELVTDPEWRVASQIAQTYSGVTLQNTPDVWVALRETFRVGQYLYPEKGNFGMWLYQDDWFQGRTVTETYRNDTITQNVRNRLGLPVYNPNLGSAKEGWTTRRTSQGDGNPYMWFKIDDGYMYNTAQAVIEVTYYDYGTDRWSLRYDSSSGERDAVPYGSSNPWVQKTNTRTWKTVSFVINDGAFMNRMGNGHDFRIDCRSDGDEWIHMVKVRRGGSVSPTPTFTPTGFPTPSPTATRPSSNIVQVQLYRGKNLVAYGGPRQPVADALLSIQGSYEMVRSLEYEYDAGSGQYRPVWKVFRPDLPPDFNTLTHFVPWQAYLIYVTRDCVWSWSLSQ